jgi:hypothetical protein
VVEVADEFEQAEAVDAEIAIAIEPAVQPR